MGKVANYLKHFFMIDYVLGNEASYHVQDYKDYTGPGFKSYKTSRYFKGPGINDPGYLKSEVAAYSEMTKIALLIGMFILVFIAVWWDIKYLQLLIRGDIDKSLLLFTSLLTIALTIPGMGMFPRAIFLVKNFKVVMK